jgi:hypothetical protein
VRFHLNFIACHRKGAISGSDKRGILRPPKRKALTVVQIDPDSLLVQLAQSSFEVSHSSLENITWGRGIAPPSALPPVLTQRECGAQHCDYDCR